MAMIVALNSLAMLHEMEEMAVEAAKKMISGRDELAVSVHKIYSEKLYLAELDEHGVSKYPTQTAYEPVLLQKLGIARQTLYNAYNPIRLACGPSFEFDYETFLLQGGVGTWSPIAQKVEYDRFTAEVEGLRGDDSVTAEEVKQRVLEAVAQVKPDIQRPELNLRPGEIRNEVTTILTGGREAIISYSKMVDTNTGYTAIRYSAELEGGIKTGVLAVFDSSVPEQVMKDVERKLHIIS